jgi:RNA polymerase sigma factor (sigma-70 family)
MSADDNKRLYPLVVAGDAEAREQMIVNNMPLVVALAESYLKTWPQYSHIQDDLVANGFLGLVKAVNELGIRKCKTTINPTSYISRSIRRCFQDTTEYDPLIHVSRKSKKRPPQTSTKHDMSKVMLSVRGETRDSIDLRDAIDSCCESPLDRELIALREIGYTSQDVAKIKGIPDRTVRYRLQAIRNRFDAKTKELQQ